MLGVDLGLRHVGLALSDPGGTLATPLRSLRLGSIREAPAAVAEVARQVLAEAVIVGAALGLEGEERRTEIRRVERFATALRRETGLPVHLEDESLSTREAEDREGRPGLPAARRGGREARDASDASHAAAAAVILQRWLDRPRRVRRTSP